MLVDSGTGRVALAGADLSSASASRSRWADLLEIDWRPRNFEIAFLLFTAIYLLFITPTHLPLNVGLARVFVFNLVSVLLLVYALSVPIVAIRLLRRWRSHGRESLRSKEVLIQAVRPYWTLNFMLLTIRRGFCILGSIYFFLHLKHLVLWINQSNYDQLYWDLDRMIHFGMQPNIAAMELVSPYPGLAVLLDWLYIKYFDYKVIVSVFFLMELRGRKLSDAYFLAYCALWSVGGLSYLTFPADGPCYSVLLEHSIDDPAQQGHLFRFPITKEVPQSYVEQYKESKIWTAKGYQYQLWTDRRKFLKGEAYPGVFYGIAAMPSLHVAAVTMIAFFLFKVSSVAGIFASIYVATTFLGSIFLQWHYAVDGYVGFVMAILICVAAVKLPQAVIRDERAN